MIEAPQTALAEQPYIAFTDGSCLGNPGPGGWAYRTENLDGSYTQAAGHDPDTTNNRMELLAATLVVEHHPEGSAVQINTDSQYVQMGADTWLENWKAKGWRTASKKPVKNRDLWQRLDVAMQTRSVTFQYVKGHSGVLGNEEVDTLAQEAARDQCSMGPVTFFPEDNKDTAMVNNQPTERDISCLRDHPVPALKFGAQFGSGTALGYLEGAATPSNPEPSQEPLEGGPEGDRENLLLEF